MKILYMDCFLGFSAGMLLGALIDAGANPDEIYAELEKENIDLSISVQYTDRASIRCRKAFAVLQKPFFRFVRGQAKRLRALQFV